MLVERAQGGDRGALEELYLSHFGRIYSYLHLSVGNRHDAEDLTSQTFLKMLEAIGRFRWQSVPFSAWLFRIAHNLAIDHFRARGRVQAEDEGICRSVQRGLRSRAYDTGRLSVRREAGEHLFHRLLHADLRSGLRA